MRVLRALSRLAGKVGERPVGFGHAVGLLTHADGFAFVAGGIPELFGEPLGHGATLLRAGRLNDPAERQGLASSLGHRDGDLVVRTADPLGTDFDVGLHIFQSLVEDADGIRGDLRGVLFASDRRSCQRRHRGSLRQAVLRPPSMMQFTNFETTLSP